MSEPPTQLLGFTLHWSDCNMSARELADHAKRHMFDQQLRLPILVKVGDGFYGFSLKDFPDGKLMLVGGHDTQGRALIRSTTNCHFNVPLDLPRAVSYLQKGDESNVYQRLTFPTLGAALASSPSRPEALEYDRPVDLKAEAGGEVVSSFTVLYTFDETYLIAHDIYKGLPLLERGVTAVPNSAPLCMSFCKYASSENHRKGLPDLRRILERAALGIDYATAMRPMNISSYGPQMPPLDDKTHEPSINSTFHFVSEKVLDLPARDHVGEYVELTSLLKDPHCRQPPKIIMETARAGASCAPPKPPPPQLPPRNPDMYISKWPQGFGARHRPVVENVIVEVTSIESAIGENEDDDVYDDVLKHVPRRRPLPLLPPDEEANTVGQEPPERTPSREDIPALAPRAVPSLPVAQVLPPTVYEEPAAPEAVTIQLSLASASENTRVGTQYEPVNSTIIVPSRGRQYCVVHPETKSQEDEADDQPTPLPEETDPKPDPSLISPPASPTSPSSAAVSVTRRTSHNKSFRSLQSVPKDLSCLTVRKVGECLKLLGLEELQETFKKKKIDGELLSRFTMAGLESLTHDPGQAQTLKEFVGGWRPRHTICESSDSEQLDD